MAKNLSSQEKITKAKAQLIMAFPFWGRIVFKLKFAPSTEVETFSTDGVFCLYNPEYLDGLTNEQVMACIAHEAGHCAFGHVFRQGRRDRQDWNIASDYALNGVLTKAGLHLPPHAYADPRYDGWSAEHIYEELHANKNDGDGDGENPNPDGQDFGGMGNMRQPGTVDPNGQGQGQGSPQPSPADQSALEDDWKVAAEQAAMGAKACGASDAAVDKMLERLRKPKLDWRAILAEFITSHVSHRFTWQRPNRRFVSDGLYLPSKIADGIGEIVVGVDTSGSVSEEELSQFASEIFAILEGVRPERVHVVYCNHALQGVETFDLDDMPDTLNARAGGGTAFTPVFDWVRENEIEPVCLVYLTDLECSDYPEETDYPTLWVSTSRNPEAKAPMGSTIHMALNDAA